MDIERVYNKLDRIDNKLDTHLERITVLEAKQESASGRIKILFSLLISGVSAASAIAMKYFLGK